MLMKICSCGRRLSQGEECICRKQKNRASYRRYDQTKRDRNRAAFYNSAPWKMAIVAVKNRAIGLDELMLSEGKLEAGNVVHHIEELKQSPEQSLTMSNLIFVSARVHRMIHKEYAKGKFEKAAMQARLRKALQECTMGVQKKFYE